MTAIVIIIALLTMMTMIMVLCVSRVPLHWKKEEEETDRQTETERKGEKKS